MKTLLALMLVLTLPVSTAFGQAWPNRPFRMVVPAAAGGTIDILTRALSAALRTSRSRESLIKSNFEA